MKTINFFETVEVILNCDISISDEFCPIDESLFVRSGIFEEGYELCTIKKDSRVFVFMSPDGSFSLTDFPGSKMCHAELNFNDFTLPADTQFSQCLKPIAGMAGVFKY